LPPLPAAARDLRLPADPAPPNAALAPEPPERGPIKAGDKGQFLFATVTGQQTLLLGSPAAGWDEPMAKRAWQAEQAWRCPVAGPLALFAQVGGAGEDPAQQDLKFAGKTGLACQVPVPLGGEFQLRSGPSVTCTDPLRPEKVQEHSELLVEVQGRLPLLFGAGLEYQGSAVPALTPLERDRITQDLRLALPVGTAGKLSFGARRRWEVVADPKPGADSTQLYMGLELSR
jgi:hypothetical protein